MKVYDGGVTSVRFVNDLEVVAVGDTRIYYSADAGVTWTDVHAGFLAHPEIIVFDESTVMVDGGSAFKRSTDGGQTWSDRAAPVGVLQEVWVRNGQEAFGVNSDGTIFRTFDAFDTWEAVFGPTDLGLSDMEFLPDGSIVTVGSDLIIRSHDGGDTWRIVNSGTARYVEDMGMFDARRGLAVCDNGIVLRTTNGGRQWVPSRPSWVVGGGWNYCTDVFLLNDQVAFIAGADGPGGIIKTTDGGETWTELDAVETSQVHGMWWIDEQHAWIGRGYTTGWIYRTADGGVSWELQYGPVAGGFWDIQFHDLQLGWALHEGKRVFRTQDGGKSWTVHELPYVHNPIYRGYTDFHFVDDQIGFTVGHSGDVAMTTNGGLSWTPINTPYFEHLQDLHVVSAQEFWAVGENHTRLHFTDGGASVTREPVLGHDLPEYGSWYTMDILPDGRQFLAGRFGVMLGQTGAFGPTDASGDLPSRTPVDEIGPTAPAREPVLRRGASGEPQLIRN